MAKVTNAFTTYGAKGNREDLADAIYNIDPTGRPFVSMIGERSVSNRGFDWQTEKLPNADTDNAKEEGFQLVRMAATPTLRQINVTQISSRDATVSGSQEAADAAGKRGEMSHQIALQGKQLLIDMDIIASRGQPRNDGDDSGTPVARRTRAMEHWITSNVSYGATGANPASPTAPITDGTIRTFSEGLLGDAIQRGYESGGKPTKLLMGPYAKRKFSTFIGRTNSRVTVDADEVSNSVDYYLSDFGELQAVPSLNVRPRSILGIDPKMAKIAYYRRLRKDDIAKIGDAETKMLVVEWGLQVNNEAAHFKIADVAPDRGTDPSPIPAETLDPMERLANMLAPNGKPTPRGPEGKGGGGGEEGYTSPPPSRKQDRTTEEDRQYDQSLPQHGQDPMREGATPLEQGNDPLLAPPSHYPMSPEEEARYSTELPQPNRDGPPPPPPPMPLPPSPKSAEQKAPEQKAPESKQPEPKQPEAKPPEPKAPPPRNPK